MQYPEYPTDFQTLDMGLVTALINHGFSLKRIVPVNHKKVTFYFDNSHALQDAITRYYEGKLFVEARQYFNDIKSLKTRVYDSIDNS